MKPSHSHTFMESDRENRKVVTSCVIDRLEERRKIWRLVQIYCFVIEKVVFKQNAALNGRPVWFIQTHRHMTEPVQPTM